MTPSELKVWHKKFSAEALALLEKKSADYSGDGDAFANFRRAEAMGLCSTETALLVRMLDKMSRLAALSDGRGFLVGDEKARDTLIDLVNYAIILDAFLSQQK